jgi:hypothetical protein
LKKRDILLSQYIKDVWIDDCNTIIAMKIGSTSPFVKNLKESRIFLETKPDAVTVIRERIAFVIRSSLIDVNMMDDVIKSLKSKSFQIIASEFDNDPVIIKHGNFIVAIASLIPDKKVVEESGESGYSYNYSTPVINVETYKMMKGMTKKEISREYSIKVNYKMTKYDLIVEAIDIEGSYPSFVSYYERIPRSEEYIYEKPFSR